MRFSDYNKPERERSVRINRECTNLQRLILYTLPNGTSVSAAGTYTSTLTTVSGCDSVITTNLSVNNVFTSTVNAQICNGSSYTLPNGTTVSAAGTYTSTLTTVSGCDSVITTNLSVNNVFASTVNAQICNGASYTLPNGTTVDCGRNLHFNINNSERM